MPSKSPYSIVLTAEERALVESSARRYTSPYFHVVRAKIVLLAADGFSNKEIAERLDVPRQIVSKWRKRFYERRLAGMDDAPRSGRTPVFPPSGRRTG